MCRRKPAEEVFIVHGHDGAAKAVLARFIERAGLKAVVLHEQPNAGRTIIEKFRTTAARRPAPAPWREPIFLDRSRHWLLLSR